MVCLIFKSLFSFKVLSLLGKRLIITFIVIRRIAKTRILNLEVAKQSQVKLFVGVSINKRQLQKTNMHL